MRLSGSALEDYLADIAELLERYGAVLDFADEELVVERSPADYRSFELRSFLPDGRRPPRSVLGLREIWRPVGADEYERWEYGYELLDHVRDYRRALHLHDCDVFIRRFDVVVHEHCERPIGTIPCDHYAGQPIRDSYQAVEHLVATWVDPAGPDCEALPCLDP